jgi:pyridoxal phosphate enzyme (YggS family)
VTLQENIQNVRHQIREACERSGRKADEVTLIAVTKYVSLETTRAVLDAGLDHIGENRWQDAQAKWEALHERGTWHFIGHLQSNKVKDVLGRFHWIHSLDRLSLAKEIEKRAEKEGLRVPCLIQLNVSGEKSKHGLDPSGFFVFLEKVMDMTHIEPRGLMTMAPHVDDPEEARGVFRRLRELRDEARVRYDLSLEHLSMGMSNDFQVAIEEGATMIRLGSILVGRELET